MNKNRKIALLRRILGKESIIKKDEYVFHCPKCNHRKPKLSVNISNDYFHCWICGNFFSGKTLIPILKLGGNDLVNEYINSSNIFKNEEKEKDCSYETPVLPDEFISFSNNINSIYGKHALKYLFNRGLTPDDILLMKLGYCESGKYKYRIIMPSFDEYGELNFFVGRAYYDNMMPYMHGNFSKDIIFNEYMIDWNEPIILVEGPFDAIKAGYNAIALQGSELNEHSYLFKKIIINNPTIYLALDKDAKDKELKILHKLMSYGINCRLIDIKDKKDVGEMSKVEFNNAMINANECDTSLQYLRLRVSL